MKNVVFICDWNLYELPNIDINVKKKHQLRQNYWSDFTQILCVTSWGYDFYDLIKIFEFFRILKIRSTYDVILTYLRSYDIKSDGTILKGLEKTKKMHFVASLYLN